jgi:hypothetical protein
VVTLSKDARRALIVTAVFGIIPAALFIIRGQETAPLRRLEAQREFLINTSEYTTWITYGRTEDKLRARIDRITRIRQAYPLVWKGNTLAEDYDRRVKERLAVPMCRNGLPGIAYDSVRVTHLTYESLQFVRMHELAHFEAEHVGCGRPRDTVPDSMEHDADCRAVRKLRPFGLLGDLSVLSAAERFYFHAKGHGNYVDGPSRHATIRGGCGSGPYPEWVSHQ